MKHSYQKAIAMMRAQSVRAVAAALTVVICSFLAILSPVPLVFAQTCTEYIAADPDADLTFTLNFGTEYVPLGANWRAGDYAGYTFHFTSIPAGNTVFIEYADTGGGYGGPIYSTSSAPNSHTVVPNTAALSVSRSASTFTAIVCEPGASLPTATPTPSNTPTDTPVPPTPTPTEVIVVTMTPSPTVTPTPVDVGAQLVSISTINYNMFLWSIFIGVVSAGLMTLGYIRLRL